MRVVLENLRVITWKISSKSFWKSHFLQSGRESFLKDVEVRLIDKTQASDPSNREF